MARRVLWVPVIIYVAALHIAASWPLLPKLRPRGVPSESYEDRVVHQGRRARQIDGAIVFIGDSHIEGLATSRIAARTENYGVGGDTLVGVTSRMQRLDLSRAKAIVILAGVNEKPGFAAFASKYEQLLAAAPDVPLFASALLPVDDSRNVSLRGINDHLPSINGDIRKACSRHPRCTFVSQPFPALLPKYHVGDGIHLNTSGYTIMSAHLRRALETHGVSGGGDSSPE